ncbi:MAG: glycoside hydrolase family 3 protein [Oscillospiraceae bacterium]|nr:glycoside hydrolase family 3 protein [Oscillospiraceae bacterium]
MRTNSRRTRLAALLILAAVFVIALSALQASDAAVTEMPADAEGVLTREEYAEIVAASENAEGVTASETTDDAENVTASETTDNATSEMTNDAETIPAPRSKAEILLDSMTVREKVCQLFMVFPEQLTGKAPVTSAGDAMREGLQRYPVAGIIFDRDSMKSREQITKLLSDTQSMSRVALLMTCDEEGGRVNRLMGAVGTPYVGPMLSYRGEGAETAKANALTIAGGLTSCGFNMDLAPVADVWSNPDNKVIGNRAYSTDFQEAAELVAAAVAGFHEGGVACTLKHFPGHGNTYEDSHNGLAHVYKTWKQLETAELTPFRAGIAAGADAVMVGHLVAGEIDDKPATFSNVIVTYMLRKELGFTGVIMTDSLQMDAIAKRYGAGEAALWAVKAGVDMLLCPDDLGAAAQELLSAVDDGRLSETRVDESVLRILRLKEAYGLL